MLSEAEPVRRSGYSGTRSRRGVTVQQLRITKINTVNESLTSSHTVNKKKSGEK